MRIPTTMKLDAEIKDRVVKMCNLRGAKSLRAYFEDAVVERLARDEKQFSGHRDFVEAAAGILEEVSKLDNELCGDIRLRAAWALELLP